MIKVCNNCNKEYEAKRESSKYCSDKCRKLAFLNNEISATKNGKSGVSVLSEVKMADKVSGTKNQEPEIIDKIKVSVPKRQLSPQAGDPKFSVTGMDDIYSPNYDLSEEGFIRRNKNWGDFSERFRENIRRDAAEIKKNIALELVMLQRMRAGGWVNPLTNTKLAPKG